MARLYALIVLGLGLTACGEPFSNDDLLFLKSLPNRALVDLRVPDDEASTGLHAAATEPQRAVYYEASRKIAKDINAGIQGTLDLVDTIVAYPPTVRTDAYRGWGPIDGGGDVEYALFVTKTSTPAVRVPTSTLTLVPAEQVFTFAFSARKKGAIGDFQNVIIGQFAPLGTERRGIGGIYFDHEAAHALDPKSEARGRSYVAYDTRASVGVALVMSFELSPLLGGMPGELGGYYRYLRAPDGGVDFRFAYRRDTAVADGEPPISALETFYVFSRWNVDHRGRADLVVADGDLTEPIGASECWDDHFLRVYFWPSIPALGEPFGTVSACAPGLELPLWPR